jgi:hypothetical protein
VVPKRTRRRVVPDPDVNHGTRYAYRHGCSCPACREWSRAHNAAARKRAGGREPPQHGTEYAYNVYACRCEPCRRGSADARAERRSRAYSKAVPAGEHGKVETYRNWGCRCNKCKEAQALKRRLRRIELGLPVKEQTIVLNSRTPRAGTPRPMGKTKPVGQCEICGKLGFDFLGGRRCYAHRPGGMMGTLV